MSLCNTWEEQEVWTTEDNWCIDVENDLEKFGEAKEVKIIGVKSLLEKFGEAKEVKIIDVRSLHEKFGWAKEV